MNFLKKLWAKTLEVYELYTWTFVVVMFLNQLLFFGLCLNPICLIAAMPHVLFITVIIGTLINKFSPETEEDITDYNKHEKHPKNSLPNEENLETRTSLKNNTATTKEKNKNEDASKNFANEVSPEKNTNLQNNTATITEKNNSQAASKSSINKEYRTGFNKNSYEEHPKNIRATTETTEKYANLPQKIVATTSPIIVNEINESSASTVLTSKVDQSIYLTKDQISIINGLVQDAIMYDGKPESIDKYYINADESYERRIIHRKKMTTKFRYSMNLKFNDKKTVKDHNW